MSTLSAEPSASDSPLIEETPLDGGGLKLHRPDRAASDHTGMAGPDGNRRRERARIITMAWGDRYIEDLLSITIPALLSPGNLPVFVQHFDCEFVIVTETRLFDLISQAPAIARLLQFCDLRLVPIDDLLSRWYGITLTYALVRGFVDLGPAMVDTHLVFLNADFIVADGSYGKLAEMILRGERLVVAPSYCMVLEDVIERLRARYDETACSMSISRRDMAEMIVAHRHNTVRAKTANQQLFRIHRYDQFYWYVDEHTLLARQMPIAVVYMRPERVLTELPTFWDYGVISEYCPTTTPCVLGDSDDFLMGELRTEGTFRELLHLGWPTIDEIAADLSSYTTKDHHDYGRHTLVLHARDLPPDIAAEKAKLQAFADAVYSRLSPPISYLHHPFWASAFPRFYAALAERSHERRTREGIEAELRKEPDYAARNQQMEALQRRLRDIETASRTIERRWSARGRGVTARKAQAEAAYRRERAAVEQDLGRLQREQEDELRPLWEQKEQVERELSDLTAQQQRDIDRRRGVSIEAQETMAQEVRAAFSQRIAKLTRMYHAFFGQLPHTTKWHPYDRMLRHANAAISAAAHAANVLVISSGGPLGGPLVRKVEGKKLTLTPKMASAGLYDDLFRSSRKFDLCVCDLAFQDLLEFRSILDKIRPFMNHGGKVVAFHHNATLRQLDDLTFAFTHGLFPLVGTSRIAFAGSLPGSIAMRWYMAAVAKYDFSRLSGLLGLASTLSACALLARLAHWIEERRDPRTFPAHCTSMTIEIEVV